MLTQHRRLAMRTSLTPREREIAIQRAAGRKIKEIATALNISQPTVEAHLRSIHQKLDVHNAVQLSNALRKHLSAE